MCWLAHMEFPYEDQQYQLPKRNILSKLLLCACSVYLHLQDQHTLPTALREYFSLTAVIVTCSLCSYTVAFQSKPAIPAPKEKYSLKAVIVCLLCVFAFQESKHTLPAVREIVYLSQRVLLLACSYGQFPTSRESKSQ